MYITNNLRIFLNIFLFLKGIFYEKYIMSGALPLRARVNVSDCALILLANKFINLFIYYLIHHQFKSKYLQTINKKLIFLDHKSNKTRI